MLFNPIVFILIMLDCAFLVGPGLFQGLMGQKEEDPEKTRSGDIKLFIGLVLAVIIASGPWLIQTFSNTNQPAQEPVEQTCICGEVLTEDHKCAVSTDTPPEPSEPDTPTSDVCKNCGAECNTEFCGHCGAAQSNTCDNCGTECDTAYCPKCGTKQ